MQYGVSFLQLDAIRAMGVVCRSDFLARRVAPTHVMPMLSNSGYASDKTPPILIACLAIPKKFPAIYNQANSKRRIVCAKQIAFGLRVSDKGMGDDNTEIPLCLGLCGQALNIFVFSYTVSGACSPGSKTTYTITRNSFS
jgi:hypothetical protein